MDNAIGLGIILSLRDKASAGLDAVRKKMTALRDVSQDMVKRFDEGAKQMIAGFASMATGGKILGILESTFGSSVATAADFEQAMARVGAVSGATGEYFEALSKQARDLGRDTQYSATQAANSQELLARAGFQTNEIMSAMPNLLYMAGAEGMDLARAADIAAGTLRGFNIEASEMSRVANVLAKTSSSTNTSIETLGESFKYVAPDAKALKVSIEEVAALVGVMGDANIKASQAGTYLRGAFNKLASPTKDTKEALKRLGISIQDSHGELKSFDTLMQEFSNKMQGMTGLKKKQLFGEIFDTRSSTGMLSVLTAFETGKLSRTIDDLYHVGDVAKEMYDRMSATAQGAQKRLESASEGMRIAIGNNLLPAYTKAIDAMAVFNSWLTQLIEAHPVISKAVIGFTTVLLGLSGTAFILVGALASIGGFIKMWPLLRIMASVTLSSIRAQASTALASLSGLRVPVVGMIALAGLLFYAWRKNLWGIRDMVTAVAEGFKMAWNAGVDGIADVDDALIQKLKAAGIWDYAVIMGQVFFRVRQFWNGLVEGFKEGIHFLLGAFDWLKGFFAPVIESGQELLTFLGILKPVTKTQASMWKAWGQLIGRIAPAITTVIAAFKGFKIIKGIFGDLGKAIVGMFSLITAHPIAALIVALVALGIYLYTHWDEVSAFFAKTWAKIKGWGTAAADWLRNKWQGFMDWWNSWTIDDVFAVIYDWFAEKVNKVRKKWNDFSAWWDSWTFADIFAPIYDFAVSVCEKVKQPFIDFKNWLLGIFANLNPFNWQLPSWLGGGKVAPSPQLLQEQKNAVQSSPQGRSASLIVDRYAKAYGVKKVDNNAQGGFITRRTLSWVGEEGPEVVIPLTKKARGASLWYEAGRELGLIQNYSYSNNSYQSLRNSKSITKFPQQVEAGRALWPVSGISQMAQAVPQVNIMNLQSMPTKIKGINSPPVINLLNFQGAETINQVMPSVSPNSGIFSQPQVNVLNSLSASAASQTIREGTTTLYNSIANIPERTMPQVNVQATAPYMIDGLPSQPQMKAGLGTSLLYEVSRMLGIVQNNNTYTENNQPSLSNNILMPPVLNSREAIYNRVMELVLPSMNNLASVSYGITNGDVPPFGWYSFYAGDNRTSELSVQRGNALTPRRLPLPSVNALTFLRNPALSNVTNSYFNMLINGIYPHAEGGIFSSPHIGLVAEAGPEAIIPLADRGEAMPMLSAAMAMVSGDTTSNVDINKPYSSSMLIQHSLNQSALYGQAVTPQETLPALKEAPHSNKIEINAEITPADIYIDGERVGRVAFRWIEHQNIRNGVSSF